MIDLKHDVTAGLVSAGIAASLPEEIGHWVLKLILGTATGLLTMGVSALIRKLMARKNDAPRT